MKVKRILSVVLAIVMLFSGIVFNSGKEVKAADKEIYYVDSLVEYYIYLGGNITINMVYSDKDHETIENPNFSGWTFKWEKYNKNIEKYEYYSNTSALTIKNASKDDFTNYKITLINKDPKIESIENFININEISKEEYEKTTTQPQTEEPTTKRKSELKDFDYNCRISGLKNNYNYTGKEIKPSIQVYSENLNGTKAETKLDPKYYTVTYKNNIKPGKASITIKGKSPYYGSKTITFKIKAISPKLSKVKVSKKKIKITCKKVKCDGYQFRYKKSTQKWGKSVSKKGWKTKSQKNNTFTTKKLKKGNYFVQVRSYVKNGNSKKYSSWTSRDQMTVVGKSTKIEKGRFKEEFEWDGQKCKFYAPKYVSKRWGKSRDWSCTWGDRSLYGVKEYNYVPVVKWIISYKRNTGYICMTDKNGVIVEEGRIEKIYK